MGQFFKFLFASCLGVFLALIALFGIGVAVIAGIASNAEKPAEIKPNTVLHLKFDQVIPDKTNNVQVTSFNPNDDKIVGLQDMLRLIEHAKDDDKIKGIFIESVGLSAGWASSDMLHDALQDFKDSGKFITSYADLYTQGSYYVASTADYIVVNPLGYVDFRGISAQVPFFKNMLDNIGVKVQVFYAGKFKSATEPYRRTNMSDESKLQVRAYLDEIYASFLSDISASRNIDIDELRKIADDYAAFQPEKAAELKVVDAAGYRDDVLAYMRDKIGLDEGEKVRMTSLENYFASNPLDKNYSVKDKIAIVYAEGTIIDGKGEYGSTGSTKYVDILQDVRKDDRVKAVVLRVNSPGGSVTASENIWREVKLLKESGKPVVVSMGDYAASGGYYIACIGDKIVAEPNTLTGSIGVFLTIPSIQGLLNDKIGINMDTVKTGKYSVGISPLMDVDADEGKILQASADATYEVFLKRVAEGRGMTRDQVNEIAQGRVWTGTKGKEIGLVDEVGDMDRALEIAAELAGLESYRTTEYPRTKDPFQQFIESFMQEDEMSVSTDQLVRMKLKDWYPYYKTMKDIHDTRGVQARLPFVIPFK